MGNLVQPPDKEEEKKVSRQGKRIIFFSIHYDGRFYDFLAWVSV